jgi:hypothetical protein
MKLTIDFGHDYIEDIIISLPNIPRKGDFITIPIEMMKLKKGEFVTYDDFYKVSFVNWYANDTTVVVNVKHNCYFK